MVESNPNFLEEALKHLAREGRSKGSNAVDMLHAAIVGAVEDSCDKELDSLIWDAIQCCREFHVIEVRLHNSGLCSQGWEVSRYSLGRAWIEAPFWLGIGIFMYLVY